MPTGYNSHGNAYNSPAVSQPGTNSYHYSNTNGSYYYSCASCLLFVHCLPEVLARIAEVEQSAIPTGST
jgi:hypothetical protein